MRILQNTKGLFLPGETLYIVTDERDNRFFNPAHTARVEPQLLGRLRRPDPRCALPIPFSPHVTLVT